MGTALTDLAAQVGAITVLLGATSAFFTRCRLGRWVARGLFGRAWTAVVVEPVTMWVRLHIGSVVDEKLEPVKRELTFNGGSTVKDLAATTARRVDQIARHLNLEPEDTHRDRS